MTTTKDIKLDDFVQKTLKDYPTLPETWVKAELTEAVNKYHANLDKRLKKLKGMLYYRIEFEEFRRKMDQRDKSKDPNGDKIVSSWVKSKKKSNKSEESETDDKNQADYYKEWQELITEEPGLYEKTDEELAAMKSLISKTPDFENISRLPTDLRRLILDENDVPKGNPGASANIQVLETFGALAPLQKNAIIMPIQNGTNRPIRGCATPSQEVQGVLRFGKSRIAVDLRAPLRQINDPAINAKRPDLLKAQKEYTSGALTAQALTDLLSSGGYVYKTAGNAAFRHNEELRAAISRGERPVKKNGKPKGDRSGAKGRRWVLRVNFKREVMSHVVQNELTKDKIEQLKDEVECIGVDLGKHVPFTFVRANVKRVKAHLNDLSLGNGRPGDRFWYGQAFDCTPNSRPTLPSMVNTMERLEWRKAFDDLRKKEREFYDRADSFAISQFSEKDLNAWIASRDPGNEHSIGRLTAGAFENTQIGSWFTEHSGTFKQNRRDISKHLREAGMDPLALMAELSVKPFMTEKTGQPVLKMSNKGWFTLVSGLFLDDDIAKLGEKYSLNRYEYVRDHYPKGLRKAIKEMCEATLNRNFAHLPKTTVFFLDDLSFKDEFGSSSEKGKNGWLNFLSPRSARSSEQKLNGVKGIIEKWVKSKGFCYYYPGAARTSQFDHVNGELNKWGRGGKSRPDGTKTSGSISCFFTDERRSKEGAWDADCFGALSTVVKAFAPHLFTKQNKKQELEGA